jgi:CXXX repeat modification system protein
MKKTPSRKPTQKPKGAASRAVGRVTPKERDEIQALFERKNGLTELVQMLQQNGGLDNNAALYEKVVADLGRTSVRSQAWWSEKAKAYGWKVVAGGHWTINFETCEIRLDGKAYRHEIQSAQAD